jgi:hypothetical protein
VESNLTRKDFEPDGVLGSRGVSEEVAGDAFAHYVAGDADGVIRAWGNGPRLTAEQYGTALDRSYRAPGLVMRRFAVPESDEPFVLDEMRPNRAIWSGGRDKVRSHQHGKAFRSLPATRREHIRRDRITAANLRRGVTSGELAEFQNMTGWEITEGGDHAGRDPREFHVHVEVAKYLFPANEKSEVTVDHDHKQWPRWTAFDHRRGLDAHIEAPRKRGGHGVKLWGHELREVPVQLDDGRTGSTVFPYYTRRYAQMLKLPHMDETHEHELEVDETHFAKRLSWHPYRREERWGRDRVLFLLEGSLKEASAVTAGEATFSCPSISLWDCRELEPFAKNHLIGKRVYVICDSDWQREDDDSVIRQTLQARDALRSFGVDTAYMAAPPPPDGHLEPSKGEPCAKHGIDDHLAHGVTGSRRGTVDQLVVVKREVLWENLDAWILEHEVWDAKGATPREEARRRNTAVLRWIATHAAKSGKNRAAFRTLAGVLGVEESSVKRSVAQLASWGCLTKHDIEERARNFATGSTEWVGHVEVHPDLRATTRKLSLREHERMLART